MATFSRRECEELLYDLAGHCPGVTSSTLRLYGNSATTAFIRGSVHLSNGAELRVFEYLDLTDGEILDYSYSVYRGGLKGRWYDAQPHPENPELDPTFPHHYQAPPDIKHNRLPAPDISARAPNLPALIEACLCL